MKKGLNKKKIYDNGGLQDYDPRNPWQTQNPNQGFQYPQQMPQNQQSVYQKYSDTAPSYTPFPENSINVQSNNTSQSHMKSNSMSGIGSMAGQFGSTIGGALHDVVNGGIQFANALLPNNKKRINHYDELTYNPYSMGNGSQAIYDDGGYIKPMPINSYKRHNIQVTEGGDFYPTESTYSKIDKFIPQQLPLQEFKVATPSISPSVIQSPSMNSRVEFNKTLDKNGNTVGYDPVFTGFGHNQALSFMRDLPDNYNGYPVNKSQQSYSEATQNFLPNTSSYQWRPRQSDELTPINLSDQYEEFKDGGIHIKPENRGKFTAYKQRTGKTTEEALHSKDPHVRQMANFARNASHWKHEDGGMVSPYTTENHYDDGGNISSNSSVFRFQGPKHEDGGIPINFNGAPAEVEGGETGYVNHDNDLVIFGNMKVPGENMKFKTAGQKISKMEDKATKQLVEGSTMLDISNPYDKYGVFSFNTGDVKMDAAKQKQKEISQRKEHLSNLQLQMLEAADKNNEEPQKFAAKFKRGGTLTSRGYDGEDLPHIIEQSANKYGIDPKILLNQVQAESGFNTGAVSNKGAVGFAQFEPNTAKQYGITKDQLKSNDPKDIQLVSDAQAHHMKDLLDQNGGDLKLALISYNGGQGAINKVRGWMKNPNATGDDIMSYWADKRAKGASKDPSAYHNQTYDYVNSILGGNNKQAFREKYYQNDLPEITPVGSNPLPVTNDFTPKIANLPNNQPQPQSPFIANNKPKGSLADRNKLGIGNFLGELGALADRPDYVDHFRYDPQLYTPYQVSYQDQLNENNASFKGIEKSLPGNAEALADLASKKYQADSGVLANQFRTNQGVQNDITNKNIGIENDAKLKNLSLDDEQYQRQAQAIANTKNRRQEALTSISDKFAANKQNNQNIRLAENLFDYRPDENYNMNYVGGPHYYGVNSNRANSIDSAKTANYDAQGNLIGYKEITPSETEELIRKGKLYDQSQKRIAGLTMRKWGGIIK